MPLCIILVGCWFCLCFPFNVPSLVFMMVKLDTLSPTYYLMMIPADCSGSFLSVLPCNMNASSNHKTTVIQNIIFTIIMSFYPDWYNVCPKSIIKIRSLWKVSGASVDQSNLRVLCVKIEFKLLDGISTKCLCKLSTDYCSFWNIRTHKLTLLQLEDGDCKA